MTIDVERILYKTMEGETIRRLMAGNDAQCFTTQQYAEERDRVLEQMLGCRRPPGVPAAPIESAKRQLRACSLVVEVSPDVWTLKQLAEAAAANASGG